MTHQVVIALYIFIEHVKYRVKHLMINLGYV